MKYAVVTFGCRVNQADSLRIEEDLRARGGVPAPMAGADLVVVNTCSVTAGADQGARQTIRRVARDNPGARIVATGCYATREPEEVSSLAPGIELVPNDDKLFLVALMDRRLGLTTAERFGAGDGSCGAAIEPGVAGRTAYTLRVQTGCEEGCTYCIIPTTRGAARSEPLPAILERVDQVASAGFREVVLTGVHLGSYGRDLRPETSLEQLLRALVDRFDSLLFRISSLEPMDCTDAIVDLVSASPALAPHFHLPLQHASDRMLEAMGRPYTSSFYRRMVDRLRDRLPHAAVGSDVIVGFPGETDDDFEANAGYLAASPLTSLHVFPYSDRPGTVASSLGSKVPGQVIRERGRRIRAIGQALGERFRSAHLGTVRPGLTLDDGTLVVTDNFLKVRVPEGRARNQRVRVRLLGEGEPMRGAIVD